MPGRGQGDLRTGGPGSVTVDADGVRAVRELVAGVVGQRSWGVRLGLGSFVTLEFGEALEPGGGRAHGRWHLWVYGSAWRLDDGGGVVAASEDARDALEQAVARLGGRVLERVDVAGPSLATVWWFEGGLALRLFPMGSHDLEHWLLYLPGGDVLNAGPGTSWSLERGAQPGA